MKPRTLFPGHLVHINPPTNREAHRPPLCRSPKQTAGFARSGPSALGKPRVRFARTAAPPFSATSSSRQLPLIKQTLTGLGKRSFSERRVFLTECESAVEGAATAEALLFTLHSEALIGRDRRGGEGPFARRPIADKRSASGWRFLQSGSGGKTRRGHAGNVRRGPVFPFSTRLGQICFDTIGRQTGPLCEGCMRFISHCFRKKRAGTKAYAHTREHTHPYTDTHTQPI